MNPPTDPSDRVLDLTVHRLPPADAQAVVVPGQTRAARVKLLLLFLFCAAPVIASYFTYYVIRPEARRNYGVLVEPQRPVPEALVGARLGGEPLPLSALRHQWLLVSVADAACDSACERHLYLSRQLREGLGREKDRVDWVWLATGDAPVRAALQPALASAQVVRLPAADLARWLEPAAGHALSDHLYVVDPMGNWMMRFPADADPAKVRKDLERLLRASGSWDVAGRP